MCAFAGRHTAINHTIQIVLYGTGYTSTLELSLLYSTSNRDDPGFRADQLVSGLEDQRDTFVNVAIICPTAPKFLVGTQFRGEKAARFEFQEKHRKHATATISHWFGRLLVSQVQFRLLPGWPLKTCSGNLRTFAQGEFSGIVSVVRSVIVESALRRLSWLDLHLYDMPSAVGWG